MLFNDEFDLLIKEEVEEEDKNFKILPENNGNFYLKTDNSLTHWDWKE